MVFTVAVKWLKTPLSNPSGSRVTSTMITIAIDTMSGDIGPAVTVPASVRALSFMPDISLLLVGDSVIIQSELHKLGHSDDQRLRIVHTTQVVSMDETPARALRHYKDSSLFRSIQLLADGEVQAAVSAGNTGALLAVGCYCLQLFEGVDRPAICAALPTTTGQMFLLDVGANIDARAENLHQFAVMGSEMAAAILVKEKPRVGLLNIGVESIKGTEQVKHAALLLQSDKVLNYTGFVEADQLFFDVVDVAVCDGFIGNVTLKASEGVARFIRHRLLNPVSTRFLHRALHRVISVLLQPFRSAINPSRYNGASFLGFTSTLVKSHGSADSNAFFRSIELARTEVAADIPGLIHRKLQQYWLQKTQIVTEEGLQ